MIRRTWAALRLLLVAVVFPLLVVGLGRWEHRRGLTDQAKLEAEGVRLTVLITVMEAADPRRPMELRFQRNGRLWGGPLALAQAREALAEASRGASVARWRREVPPVVVGTGLAALILSGLVLVLGTVLGWAGRWSRRALAAGFGAMGRILPLLLMVQVLAGLLGLVAVLGFEAAPVLYSGPLSNGGLGALVLIGAVAAIGFYGGVQAMLQLRGALDVFTPAPLPILGRTVWPAEAPGLWARLDRLATRLGALPPETVVVGLTGSVFVSAGPKRLEPGGALLSGRTLYMPLPLLVLMHEDEVDAILAHELAHFSGQDTEYSGRFLPIYAGVERSLRAVLAAPLLARPAVALAGFVLNRFHYAVRRWSREREFAADAAGAAATSAEASGRALLRVPVAAARAESVLDQLPAAPGPAAEDLVATILAAASSGLDDPVRYLVEQQPHPTDTHPPTVQRMAALGLAPKRMVDPDRLIEAAAPPPPDAAIRLALYFADPATVCRTATADLLGVLERQARHAQAQLEQAAGAVAPDPLVLHENTRPGGLVQLGAAILFGLAALALLAFGMPGFLPGDARFVAAMAAVPGLGLAALGVVMLRRARRPFLVLRPDAMVLPGLSLPVAWTDVIDLDITMGRFGLVTRILLRPEAPLPARQGAGRARVDARRRIVTLSAAAPRGFGAQAFAELIGRYRRAAEARHILAGGPAPP